MSPSFAEFCWGVIGFAAHAALWLWCFGAIGWSFLRSVAQVSIPSTVVAVAAGGLIDWGSAAARVLPVIIGFGGGGLVMVIAAWVRLCAPDGEDRNS